MALIRKIFILTSIIKNLNAFSIIPRRNIHKSIPNKVFNPLEKVNGFYGLIGPNVNTSNINNLYDLFTGDGIIQGVFINNGKITPVKHLIETDKLQYEKTHINLSKHFFMLPLNMFLSKLGIIPSIMNVANTALLRVKNNVFSLFERDMPHKICVDFQGQTVTTIGKQKTKDIPNFSAHSKYVWESDTIHTIDYNVFRKTISYFQIDSDFRIFYKKILPCKYYPITHDFYLLETFNRDYVNEKIIFIDAPFVLELKQLFRFKNPFVLSPSLETYIGVYDTDTNETIRYRYPSGFYIFHYARVIQTSETYEIYGSVYESVDFTSLDIDGKFRKLILDKKTGTIKMETNPILEMFNLDFPIIWKDYTILRNIENKKYMNGFVICKGISIVKLAIFNEIDFAGEPQCIEIDGRPFLLAFGKKADNESGALFLIDIELDSINAPILHEYPLDIDFGLGFHSIFLKYESKI